MRFLDRLVVRAFEPQPVVRLEVIRILAPLAIVGFMSSRIAHADDWLSSAGFHPPPLQDDYRQPAHFTPLAPAAAWVVGIAIVISGLSVVAGAFTRWSATAFGMLLAYVTLADRMEAFTVSKLGTVVAFALALTPAGTRYSFDAWRKRGAGPPPELCSGGNVRFFQILLPVFYFSSGICKAKGDWLSNPYVLWSHLHDSYQTPVSLFFANHMPRFAWTVMQATTLAFEALAPVWFALRWTRPYALAYGIAMHTLIGMMFGPVAWFALLMIALLVGAYAPITWLQPTFGLNRGTVSL